MKYQHVIAYVASQLWAIEPAKFHELLSVLAYRAGGRAFTKAEIAARIGDGTAPPSASRVPEAVVIPIRGVIAHRMGSMDDTSGGTSCERIGAMIDQVAADPSIHTIVYDIDSPGGTVPGVSELAGKMFALRGVKKQIAQVNDLAASAAYWLASQADEIVSIPSGTTGSIGVFAAHKDVSKALANEGIDVTLISAGKYKVEESPFAPLSPEAKAFMQDRVDTAYAQFVKDVARGRGVSQTSVRDGYGEGRVLGAKDALKAGLIDNIGTMESTLGRLVGRKTRAQINSPHDPKSRASLDRQQAELRADVQVLVCDCSPDCPCQNDGVCGENCATCEPDCACIAPDTMPATPMPMPAGPSSAQLRRLL